MWTLHLLCFVQNFSLATDLDVKVLTTGFWPSYKTAEQLALPRQMVDCVEAFQKFYTETTKHRNLTWIHNLVCAVLSHCSLVTSFERSSKTYP